MPLSRILIIGGGFSGVKCAKVLRARLPRDRYEIVILNRENHLVFHPLLAEVVGGSINPNATAAPLRQMLPGVHCHTVEVQEVDLKNQSVKFEKDGGRPAQMAYDHLVLASGVGPNLSVVPGMSDHAFPLKTVGDALCLSSHVMEQLEKAELCDDAELRRWYLSYIVIGGGFSGVEVAGEINDLVRSSRRFFQNISADELTVTLIHSRDQILPEVSPSLRDFAQRKMEKTGIKILLGERVSQVTSAGTGLKSGARLRGATVVCTIGNVTLPFIERLDSPKERGKLITEPDMRIAGFENAWAIGDCAQVINSYDDAVCPPTGQFAERQGGQVARNIIRALRGQTTRPFRFKQLGQLCAIGGHSAVAELFGMRLSGFLAWFLWRTIYLMKLPSWSGRVKLAFDWTWELMFSRDLAHLKTNVTDRVTNAYYNAGAIIFAQGDPSANFYVIKKGEVEVLRPAAGDGDEVITVLGPGDFFGEMALLENQPHRKGVRARSPVEVLVMGKDVFSRISGALTPLKEIFAAALRRRTDIWQHLPRAHEVLQHEPLSTFIEPLPAEPLNENVLFDQALPLFSKKKQGFFFVVNDQQQLAGILTRTDLLRVVEAAALNKRGRADIRLKDIMETDIIAVKSDDSAILAVSTMREHGVKKLPVVSREDNKRLAGYVRIEQLMDFVVQKVRPEIYPAEPTT